jgi:hypothetical protein
MPGSNGTSAAARLAKAKSALAALRSRCQWPTVRRMIRESDLRAGQGWDDLDEILDGDSENAKGLIDLLPQLLVRYVTVGERYLRLYTYEKKEVSELLPYAKRLTPSVSAFSHMYPFPIQAAALGTAPEEPTLVEVREIGRNATALVFCSRRAFEVRDHMTPDKMGAEVQKALAEFDELIAIRRIQIQAYDVVVLRGGVERIEFRLDQPKLMLSAEIYQEMEKLCNALRKLIPAAAPIVGPANVSDLFPAVSGIYNNANEGLVVDLAFQTHTGSFKRERMRHRKDDLRLETFHKGGKKAIRKIFPFHLCISWQDITDGARIELTLPGRARHLSGNDILAHAIVSNVASESEMAAVANKLVSYL